MKQQGLVQYFQTAKKVLRKLIALQRDIESEFISHKIIKVGEHLKRTFKKQKRYFYITSEKESTNSTTTEVAEKERGIKVEFI